VQEALSNIARHARAKRVKVTVRGCTSAQVKVSIVDDGVGLPRDHLRDGGAGLAGMRERALLAGGSLDVLPTPGGGTTIELTVYVRGAPAMTARHGSSVAAVEPEGVSSR
jgi:two-component system sensor histidine kinase UhpB